MAKPHTLPTQEKWIKLSAKEIKHIFIYYFITFLMSLLSAGLIFYYGMYDLVGNIGMILIFAFICGLLGSTFYYIRKLYKSCIQFLVDTEANISSIVALGAKVYFYFRPIMGATLAVLTILGIYGGFFFLQNQPAIDTERFFIFSALVSFFVGFSNGDIIINLDKGKSKFTDIIKIGKEED